MQVFLHIGHPKTGTSAFQRHLSEHRMALRKAGIVYPAGGWRFPWQHGEALAQAARFGNLEELERILKRHEQASRLVLSGETLANVPCGAGKALCQWLMTRCELHVLYTVRDWQSYLPSRYRQNIRRGDGWDFQAFRDASRAHFAENPDFNYAINSMEYSLPGAHLHLFEYGPDILRRLLDVIGIPASLFKTAPSRQNSSLGFLRCEQERLLNVLVNRALGQAQNRKFDSVLGRSLLSRHPDTRRLRLHLHNRIEQGRLRNLCRASRVELDESLQLGEEAWQTFLQRLAQPHPVRFWPCLNPPEQSGTFSYSLADPCEDRQVQQSFLDAMRDFSRTANQV